MKQKPLLQIILILLVSGLFFSQCKEEHECPECEICEEIPECKECEDCPECEECEECTEGPQYLTVFDSLQGVWSFYRADGPYSEIDIGFETSIHIANINRDSSMYYETYKNDTLIKSGFLKVARVRGRDIKLEPNISLHFMDVLDVTYLGIQRKNIDLMGIYDGTRTDQPIYKYERIK